MFRCSFLLLGTPALRRAGTFRGVSETPLTPTTLAALLHVFADDQYLVRGGLVFKAHRLVYYSTLGLRVIKKKKRSRQKWPELEPLFIISFGGWPTDANTALR